MRRVNYIFLAMALILSALVILDSLTFVDIKLFEQESAVIIAAALAVVTSAFASASAQRTVDLQEDALKPYPYPFFDLKSRPGIPLFRVKNFGGTVARDIEIIWDKNKPFNLKSEIKILLPGETISYHQNIDSSVENPGQTFYGSIKYKDASGCLLSHQFYVNYIQHENAYNLDDESSIVQLEFQKIPESLKHMNENLVALKKLLEQNQGKNRKSCPPIKLCVSHILFGLNRLGNGHHPR